MISHTRLPEYPEVKIEGKKIFIVYRNGEEMSWGEEASEELAISASKELNLELKAIEYVKTHVYNFINDIRNTLQRENISEDHLEQILFEGHHYAMKELGFSYYSNIRDRIYSKYLENPQKAPSSDQS
jgi:hypothetical protein